MSCQCNLCEKKFANMFGYQYHVDNKVCEKNKCYTCGKILTNKTSYENHVLNKICERNISKKQELISELNPKSKLKLNPNPKPNPKSLKIPQSIRHKVWETYMGNYFRTQCPVCDCNEISVGNFECGHVVSRAKCGLVTVDNLRPICGECNNSMGTQNLIDFAEKHFPNASVLLTIQTQPPMINNSLQDSFNNLTFNEYQKMSEDYARLKTQINNSINNIDRPQININITSI